MRNVLTPDDRALPGAHRLLHPVRLVGDQPVQVALLDRLDHAAALLEVVHDGDDLRLHGVGQRLDVVGTAERVGDPRHAGLVRQHLLGAQRERRGLLAGQRERLVPGRGEHRLHAAEHRGHRLVGDPHDVVVRLRCVERRAAGDAADPEHARAVVLRAVALPDDARPAAPAGAVLRDLLEEVAVRVEEERDLRRELVDRHPAAGDDLVAVGDAVHQRERHLLRRVRAGVAEVRTGHRDRVEARDLLRRRTRSCRRSAAATAAAARSRCRG